MTKAAICTHCWDIVSPHRDWRSNRAWRWCACHHAATRWRDGDAGLLEVSAFHGPDHVRVLGLNNSFLMAAFNLPKPVTDTWWRDFHRASTDQVAPNYLFHKDRRDCWALLTRVGESGDVFWFDYEQVIAEGASGGAASVASADTADEGK